MFGLSTWEILIILAVALIFVGPDQLPKVARQIGKGVRQVRGAVGKVDDEMRRAVREAAAEMDDDGNPVGPGPGAPAAGDSHPPNQGLPPSDAPAPAPNAAPPASTPIERDWSQVGKAPVGGTIARPVSAAPGRPATETAKAPEPAKASDAPEPAPIATAPADDKPVSDT